MIEPIRSKNTQVLFITILSIHIILSFFVSLIPLFLLHEFSDIRNLQDKSFLIISTPSSQPMPKKFILHLLYDIIRQLSAY